MRKLKLSCWPTWSIVSTQTSQRQWENLEIDTLKKQLRLCMKLSTQLKTMSSCLMQIIWPDSLNLSTSVLQLIMRTFGGELIIKCMISLILLSLTISLISLGPLEELWEVGLMERILCKLLSSLRFWNDLMSLISDNFQALLTGMESEKKEIQSFTMHS